VGMARQSGDPPTIQALQEHDSRLNAINARRSRIPSMDERARREALARLSRRGGTIMHRTTFTQFLICGGMNGWEKSCDRLHHLVGQRRPDAILFAGGIIDPLHQAGTRAIPLRLTRDDVLFCKRFFELLGQLEVFTAVIPGPNDRPIEEILRIGMNAEFGFPNVHLVHARLIGEKDLVIGGIGGLLVEQATDLDHCSRTMAEYYLASLAAADPSRKIMLLPAAPPGVPGGTEGNQLAGDLIESYHPWLCVVGGSQRSGTARIARTLIINPGWLAEGRAAWYDASLPAADAVEVLDLHAVDVPVDTGVGD
jgi:Icc-related predicted phosphoesterase